MAQSTIGLVNRSLALLGMEPISNLNEVTKSARLASTLLDGTRASLFREHNWNCLIKRISLAKEDVEAGGEYQYKFALPADYLRILSISEDSDMPYLVEGNSLLCDLSKVTIRYVSLVEDAKLIDATLYDVLATRLAADLAQGLSNDPSLVESMWAQYLRKVYNAYYLDSIEQSSYYSKGGDEWLKSRFGGSFPTGKIKVEARPR